MTRKNHTPTPTIWAIGGGKGGVGKSIIAVNLAISLARRGITVTLVDMDLGGANAHTLLGLSTPSRKLDDFVQRRLPALADTVTPTGIENLGLIAGAGAGAGAANTPFAQKERLLRNLKTLPSRIVLLDLGAGSAFNVLDFFVAADLGLIVTIPEHTSVENSNAFLRAAFFRRLARSPATRAVRSLVRELAQTPRDGRPVSPRHLLAEAGADDAEAAHCFARALAGFTLAIGVNQIRLPRERDLPEQMAGAVREYFGVAAMAAGALPADRLVTRSVRERRPVVEAYPGGPFSAAIDTLASTLLATGSSHA